MIAVLALIVSIASITLLAFGERLGLAAGFAGFLIPVILALFVLVIALVSATSRLTVYLDASDGRSAIRSVATQLVLVFTGIVLLQGQNITDLRPSFGMLAAYILTLALVPSREPMSRMPEAERRMGGPDRALAIGFATIGFSMILFILWFQPALIWLSKASGFEPTSVRQALLGALACVVLLGGLSAIARLAEGALAFTLLFAGLPFLAIFGVEILRMIDPATGLNLQGLTDIPAFRFPMQVFSAGMILPILIGIGLGLASLASVPALGVPVRRGGFGVLIATLAGLLAFGFAREAGALPALVMRDLIPVAPQNWPLFVFDEAIRGWLLVCQEAPRDANDVIQACRRSGVTGAIPPEMFEIRPDMIGPALAAARGIPAALGLVSGLLGPMMAFVALALLLQVSAAGIAETIVFRVLSRRALRAARLTRARLVAIALLAPFVVVPGFPALPDQKFLLWAGLSLALLLAFTLLADWMLAALRWFRKIRRKPDTDVATSAIDIASSNG
jgi:hypothetical protein